MKHIINLWEIYDQLIADDKGWGFNFDLFKSICLIDFYYTALWVDGTDHCIEKQEERKEIKNGIL